jgi:DNA-directed RNA polymerase specialized sigma24 family protein
MSGGDDTNRCDLVAGLKANDQAAWALLVERYTKPLLQLVRQDLLSGIRSKVGEDDIVQEVFRDLFVDACRRRLPCDTEAGLWGILAHRARTRVLHERRRFLAARRDVRRENPQSSSLPADLQNGTEPADPHAEHEHPVVVHDQFVAFVNSLEWIEQVLVHLRLEHGTLERVADLLDWSLRKVEGIWEGICKKAREGSYGWMEPDRRFDPLGAAVLPRHADSPFLPQCKGKAGVPADLDLNRRQRD